MPSKTLSRAIYLVAAKRTPFGTFGGKLKDISAIDLGVVASYGDMAAAKDVASRLLDRAHALRQRPALMFIGIERYIEPLVAVAAAPAPAKGRHFPELHVAYRLSGDDLSELLTNISKLQRLRERLHGG